jgi:hypothetical protein
MSLEIHALLSLTSLMFKYLVMTEISGYSSISVASCSHLNFQLSINNKIKIFLLSDCCRCRPGRAQGPPQCRTDWASWARTWAGGCHSAKLLSGQCHWQGSITDLAPGRLRPQGGRSHGVFHEREPVQNTSFPFFNVAAVTAFFMSSVNLFRTRRLGHSLFL